MKNTEKKQRFGISGYRGVWGKNLTEEITFQYALAFAKTIKESTGKPDRYFEAIGRRKTAVARVRLFTKGDKDFLVNNKSYKQYFSLEDDQETAVSSMKKMMMLKM